MRSKSSLPRFADAALPGIALRSASAAGILACFPAEDSACAAIPGDLRAASALPGSVTPPQEASVLSAATSPGTIIRFPAADLASASPVQHSYELDEDKSMEYFT